MRRAGAKCKLFKQFKQLVFKQFKQQLVFEFFKQQLLVIFKLQQRRSDSTGHARLYEDGPLVRVDQSV